MAQGSEFEKFDLLATSLIRVPHSKIKAALDAEKREKAERPKRKRKPVEKK